MGGTADVDNTTHATVKDIAEIEEAVLAMRADFDRRLDEVRAEMLDLIGQREERFEAFLGRLSEISDAFTGAVAEMRRVW